MPVADVTPELVPQVLEPKWTEKTKTMKDLRGRIAKVNFAAVKGYRPEDPYPAAWKDNLEVSLAKPKKVRPGQETSRPAVRQGRRVHGEAPQGSIDEGQGPRVCHFMRLTGLKVCKTDLLRLARRPQPDMPKITGGPRSESAGSHKRRAVRGEIGHLFRLAITFP